MWVLAVAASVVVIVVLALLSNHPPTAQLTNTIAPPNGATAPDFSATAADDKSYSLAQFRGSPVLVEFMAPWCSHCQAEAPMFNQIHDTYTAKGVQMLGVSASPYGHTYDQTNSPPIAMDDLKWFSTTYSVTYPLLFDPELKAANAYAIQAYPTVYIVDKAGTIQSHFVYPFDQPTLTAELDKALAAK